MGDELVHVLLISFPAQGHVNPALRLAKLLAFKGLFVTFSTTEAAARMMQEATDSITNTPTPIGKGKLRFDSFSDGSDINYSKPFDHELWMEQFTKYGPQAVAHLIARLAGEGRPVSCIIGNPFMPWVVDVATDMSIPCAILWVQSCAVFSAYYHHCHGMAEFPTSAASNLNVQLPGMPVLCAHELPSFLLENTVYKVVTEALLNQFKNMSKASWVMVDSFEELEKPVIQSIAGLSPVTPVGPLFRSIQGVDSSSVRGDMWRASECIGWLDSHPPSSVVYISFGSVVFLESDQMEEIAWGIRNSGRPFLWVVKPRENTTDTRLPKGFLEETGGRGMVVKWCPQERVLSHPSVACFVTHCGWNSSMESLCCGVPVIGFPQWGDQVTNAKFLEEVHGVGFRLGYGKKSLVLREEVERCINEIMGSGSRAEEVKKNALKWKNAAAEAVAEGGSSDKNIQDIVDDIRQKAANQGFVESSS